MFKVHLRVQNGKELASVLEKDDDGNDELTLDTSTSGNMEDDVFTSEDPARTSGKKTRSRHVPSQPVVIHGLESIPERDDRSLLGSTDSIDSADIETLHTKKTLTVNKKWKVDEQLHKRMLAANKPSILIPIAKWISTILLALGLFACLATSKLYMLKMGVVLQTASEGDTRSDRISATRAFLVVFLALATPYLLNLLRAMFTALCRSDMPWPRRKAVVLGIVLATLESFGLCVFALKVITYFDGVTAILLMNSIFLFPFLSNTIRTVRSRLNRHKIIFVLGLILQLVGVAITVYIVIKRSTGNMTNIWYAFVSVGCLSFAWIPGLLQRSVKPIVWYDVDPLIMQRPEDCDNPEPPSISGSVSSGFQTGPTTPITSIDLGKDEEVVKHLEKMRPNLRNTTWKMAIISNFTKLIGVVVFSFVLFYLDGTVYNANTTFTSETWDEFVSAWNFNDLQSIENLLLNLGMTALGYAMAFMSCHIATHKWAFGLPICFTLPAFVVLLTVKEWCVVILDDTPDVCNLDTELYYVILAASCLFLAHILSATFPIFNAKVLVLQRESACMWLPNFNGVCLEQWLIVNRKSGTADVNSVQVTRDNQKTKVYICTTMYRENEDEMRQLLESINRINMARRDKGRFFESHVILDGGVRNKNISEFALQLLSLLEETLNIRTEDCTKIKTPYGMKLSWKLPRSNDKINHMIFNIHLKDGLKVKNKKRWSQIMYMSYVIDFLMESENDENCYILTTDADVKFTPESVEALLDLMTRDARVGAVCARTHPMGSGPLVWYQVFEYAIGHWFQKAAEHVLGSVLCAPGCFSVYRCVALKEILTVYATNVEHAFDFLTKDMGEDRWLCTLMVQSGWRIEYCAASENSTNCPSEFEEFYKQRRRWIASTIANLMLVMKQWQIIRHFNKRVSLLFIVYQGALLFSTLIGPSTVILIISGGLVYAWEVDSVTTVILQIILCIMFAVVCLYTSDKTQMMTAKLVTFLYAVVMTAVVVGTAEQIVEDLGGPGTLDNDTTPTVPPQDISVDLPISVTTIYFAAIASIFGTAALLHPRESYCLVNGVWYLLCLPSGYLVLMIYSVCNITDRSWGTREEKTETVIVEKPWYDNIRTVLENIFFCCSPKPPPQPQQPTAPIETQTSHRGDDHRVSMESLDDGFTTESPTTPGLGKNRLDVDDDLDEDVNIPVPVEEWLDPGLKERYVSLFKNNGFENTMMIAGMTEKELKNIGVTVRAHQQAILRLIETLPAFEIEYHVPTSVDEWLETIGLYCYRRHFRQNHIRKPEDLSILKSFKRKEIEKELHITKFGHIKRLMYAIRKLREPTEAERRAMEMKARVDRAPQHSLRQSNIGEYDFWKQLIEDSLKPGNKAFGIEGELKDVVEIDSGESKTGQIKRLLGSFATFFSLERLSDLRNSWLLILAVSNTLWLILITTLASKGELTILGANPLGLSFLFIFGTLLLVQFLAMIIHRISTLVHFLARAPFRPGEPLRAFWSFTDDVHRFQKAETKDDWEAIQTIRHQEEKRREAKQQERLRVSRSYASTTSERTPLLRTRPREIV